MKQRVGIARALAMEPKILLLDEPFGALDALTRAHLQDAVMEIHTALGNTMMMVTHDVDEAVLLSDRIVDDDQRACRHHRRGARASTWIARASASSLRRTDPTSSAALRVLEFLYERHRFVDSSRRKDAVTQKLSSSATAWPQAARLEKLFELAPGLYDVDHLRRRAAGELQPHHALAGALGREDL